MGNHEVITAVRAIAPAVAAFSLTELERLADFVAASNLYGIKTKQQAIVLMLIAHAEGRHPVLAARDYDIIQGRPAKKTEAMMRDFLENNGKVEWHTLTDTECEATFSHPSGGTAKITWDMERARTAGLAGKDSWRKYPRQMLRSRVVSEGVRTVCPMATSGMYVPEEMADVDNGKSPVVAPLPLQDQQPIIDATPMLPENKEPALMTDAKGNLYHVDPVQPEPDDPPFDPETGEIIEPAKPHNIGVMENKNGKANWVQFGSEFIAALQGATSRDEAEAWIKENKKLLNACKKEAEKVFGRISSFVEVTRQKFPQQVEVTI